jgi:hypothetical protein
MTPMTPALPGPPRALDDTEPRTPATVAERKRAERRERMRRYRANLREVVGMVRGPLAAFEVVTPDAGHEAAAPLIARLSGACRCSSPVAPAEGDGGLFGGRSRGILPHGVSPAEILARIGIKSEGYSMTKSRNVGRGGARPGAGRPPNKPTFELPEQRATYAAATTPLAFLLATMRDPLADPKRRDKAAVAAAPYCHPRKASS